MKRFLVIALVAAGCGSDAPAKTDPNPTTDPDMGTAGADMQTEEDCTGLERFYDGECIVAEKWVSVRLTAVSGTFPDSFGAPLVCASVLSADEDEARSFVSFDRVVEQTDDCLVTERIPDEERAAWPYVADPDGFETATVRQGENEWVLDSVDDLFDDCLTNSSGIPFEFGETYDVEVPTGRPDTSFFPATITIPDDPQQDCPVVVSGEPVELAWTPSGASTVTVQARIGDFRINCSTDDTGEFTIPPELTSLLPATGVQLVEVRPQNFAEHYNPETGTLTTFLGDAWASCDFVD